MNLLINSLIEWHSNTEDEPQPHVERVLWIENTSSEAVVIKLFDKRALPIKRHCAEIVKAIAVKEAHILQTDPYLALLRHEDEIKESHRKRRDEAWRLIESLLTNTDRHFLLIPNVRGPLIAALAARSKKSKKIIYEYLRRYWQAGGVRNALLPAFYKCGGRGKRRVVEDINAPKLGRKSAVARLSGSQNGIRVTTEVERRFERGIKKFFETTERRSLAGAYQLMLGAYFHQGFEFVDGVVTPVLPPAEQLPSLRQFRYWYEKIYRDVRKEKVSREGEREYNLQGRELLGDSTQMAHGPGSIYQIDATIGDIYLVSSLDRTRIIGRPVIYVCIDVFSRMITGFYVTLEGPSWLGAMLTLDNVTANKVAFCSEFGITIQEDEWPCSNLPEAILADRGEFEGYNASNLVNALGIRIHNTAPWRADWKGIVERHFGIASDRVIKFTPGYVPRVPQRGDPDYALGATLTLNELRKVLICHALDHNTNHYMKWYRRDEFMIADHVPRYPLDIWNWGIRTRSGHLLMKSQDIVRLNLLPRKTVSVTPRGIHFEGEMYYTCDLAMREGWFPKARAKGSWKIEVAFDLRSTDYIYLPLNGGTKLETCYLTPASVHLQGRDWHEVRDCFALDKR